MAMAYSIDIYIYVCCCLNIMKLHQNHSLWIFLHNWVSFFFLSLPKTKKRKGISFLIIIFFFKKKSFGIIWVKTIACSLVWNYIIFYNLVICFRTKYNLVVLKMGKIISNVLRDWSKWGRLNLAITNIIRSFEMRGSNHILHICCNKKKCFKRLVVW